MNKMYSILKLFLIFVRVILSELIFDQPVYNLQSPNFTLGGLFRLTENGHSTELNADGVEKAITMMCTLKIFNAKEGPFPLEGIFNGLVYDSAGNVKQSEYSAMKLLSFNIKQGNNNGYVNTLNGDRIQVGAIIADIDTDVFFGTQPIFSGFPFTFLGVQFLSNGFSTNSTSLPRPTFKSRLVPQSFVISAASCATMAEAILKMLLYFNWSLVTVVYGRDVFGLEGQAFLQPLLQENSVLTACSVITKTSDQISQVQNLADCLNSSDSRVVILWSGASSQELTNFCDILQSKTKFKLVFISPGSDSSDYVPTSSLQSISTSFLFKSVNLIPISDSLRNCLKNVNPDNQKYFDSDSFYEYWIKKFNCLPEDDQCIKQSTLQASLEINQVTDSTMLILKAISLMQTNCTLLNQLLVLYNLTTSTSKDYCEKNQFSASDIYEIVNLVLYLGLPAFLALGSDSDSKESSSTAAAAATISMNLLQINEFGQFAVIGNYSNSGILRIDNSSLYWTGDQVPVSSVLVSNPNLNDSIVIVFLSFAILALIFSFYIKTMFIIYKKEKFIKRSSPVFNFIILIGLDLILTSLIVYGLDYTTTTCFLFAWSLVIGIGLSLSGILVKSYRIFRIFKNSKAVALIIPENQLFGLVGAVFIVEIILLSIYSFASSSGLLGPQVIQSTLDIYYKYRICLVPSKSFQLWMSVSIYSFNLIILLSIATLAFLTRKIDNNLSEASAIAYTVYSTLTFQIIFLPLLYTSQNSTGSDLTRYILTGLIILFSSCTALIFLFQDKIVKIYKN